jgi:hypothetical protein
MISHESDINYVQSCNLFNLYTVYNIVIKSVFIRLDLEKKYDFCVLDLFLESRHIANRLSYVGITTGCDCFHLKGWSSSSLAAHECRGELYSL